MEQIELSESLRGWCLRANKKFMYTNSVLLIKGDMNVHVGENADGLQGIHGGKWFGDRNEEGEKLLESCVGLGLVQANTFYTKKERAFDLGGTKDCKDIPGDAVVSQHRLSTWNLGKKP